MSCLPAIEHGVHDLTGVAYDLGACHLQAFGCLYFEVKAATLTHLDLDVEHLGEKRDAPQQPLHVRAARSCRAEAPEFRCDDLYLAHRERDDLGLTRAEHTRLCRLSDDLTAPARERSNLIVPRWEIRHQDLAVGIPREDALPTGPAIDHVEVLDWTRRGSVCGRPRARQRGRRGP